MSKGDVQKAPIPEKFNWKAEFSLQSLIPTIASGLVVSVIVVVVAVSLASLIFIGDLAPFLDKGISIMLFTGVLTTAIISLTSSYPGMVAYPQERVAPILAVICAGLATKMVDANPETLFYTAIAAILLAALINGSALYLLGHFRLGSLIRYIPYPVIGGFLAGTGYLLVKGSLGVMVDMHLHMSDIGHLFTPSLFVKWLPGVTFGALLFWTTHRYKHFLVMPGIILGSVALFYVVLLLTGTAPAEAQESGWLLGPFPSSESWRPLSYDALTMADWSALMSQSGNLATILVISIVSVLLNSGSLELTVKEDIDLNRELKSAGIANIVIGIGGGTVGFHSLSISRLAHKMGSRSRLVGLTASLVCLGLLIAGPEAMSYLPRCVLGGLLFFLGLHFLDDWLWKAWFRLTRADYFVVCMILLSVAIAGYLYGVGVGLVACVILFLINYSGVNVVKHTLSGTDQHSNVDRPARHNRALQVSGIRLHILKLQGFIFFGTANSLLEQVRERIEDVSQKSLRFLILDFKHVSGIDSSSIISFLKMRQIAERNGFTLIFTQINERVRDQIDREGFYDCDENVFRTFMNLDYGLEWCENKLLDESNVGEVETNARAQLSEAFTDKYILNTLMSYFERHDVKEGETFISQGEPADSLYLVDSGQLTATLDVGSQVFRLRTFSAGAIVGEIGMLLGGERTANIIADQSSVLYRLSTEGLKRLRVEQPDLAARFLEFLGKMLATRLVQSNKTLKTLLD